MLHPSYVYGVVFYPDEAFEKEERLVFCTVCYDQKVRVWVVQLNGDGTYAGQKCELELSIMEKPVQGIGIKKSIYEQEELEDETLQLIIHPNKTTQLGSQNTIIQQSSTIFDYIHPNCISINKDGRLFVGDSRGHISAWDITIRHGSIYASNYFKIRQKELEGDEINQIICHPNEQNKLFVVSRDNCIRLVEYDSFRGPRIRKRFFGAKCKD